MVVNVNYDDVKVQIKDLIEAAMRGDKVIITKDGQQIVQLVPMKTKRKQPKFGSAKGNIKFAPDFDAPLADFSEYVP
jgi:prevent-host-death family protein